MASAPVDDLKIVLDEVVNVMKRSSLRSRLFEKICENVGAEPEKITFTRCNTLAVERSLFVPVL